MFIHNTMEDSVRASEEFFKFHEHRVAKATRFNGVKGGFDVIYFKDGPTFIFRNKQMERNKFSGTRVEFVVSQDMAYPDAPIFNEVKLRTFK